MQYPYNYEHRDEILGGMMSDWQCDKCGHGDFLVTVTSVGDVVCEGCGEWQGAELNDVWERVK